MPRPPIYKSDPGCLEKILAALRGGATRLSACEVAGVTWATLERWIDDDPEVRNKIDAAESAARDQGARPSSLDAARPPKSEKIDRWAQIRADAGRLGPGLFGLLLWLEARIAEHNERSPAWDHVPPMPPPLLAIFRDFWASAKQELLVRGGRGLGKSTMFTRPTIIECLFAPRVVNGGEIAIWPELSVDMDEANLKVSVLEKLLEIAGFRRDDPREDFSFKTLKQERGRTRIQFMNAEHERIEIRVYPATVRALSGPTLKGGRHDEEAKWKTSAKDETNSAEEVLDAEAGAFRGREHAHLYRVSSAWKTSGAHYRDVEGIDDKGIKVGNGDTAARHIARIGDFLQLTIDGLERVAAAEKNRIDAAEIRMYAATLTPESPNLPSWFNPSLDPLALRARSRNVRVFLREYASRSTGGEDDGDFFDPLLLDAAESRARPHGTPDACYAAIDTGAKRNPAALAIVGLWLTRAGRRVAPMRLRSWRPRPGAPLDLRLVVLPAAAREALANGCGGWTSDGFASDQIDLVSAAEGIEIAYVATSEAYRDVYEPVAAGLARGEICLNGCDGAAEAVAQLRRVSSVTEVGGKGAHVRMVIPEDAGGEHGDLGVALVRALAAAGVGRVEEDDGEILGAAGRYAGTRGR